MRVAESLAPLQALVVKTASWEGIDGVLSVFERVSEKDPWECPIESMSIVVGRNGMGWGYGIHPIPLPEGPVKIEGDGRSPAGIFRLSSTFGYFSANEAVWIKMPYQQIFPGTICIDDPRSTFYNRIVDAPYVMSDWESHELMLRTDGLYQYGIVVDHNMHPALSGRGSCIFIHVWRGPLEATEGCTAMALENIERLLRRLNPLAQPVLIQLPEEQYEALREHWNLP